jgi:hypothetical protein
LMLHEQDPMIAGQIQKKRVVLTCPCRTPSLDYSQNMWFKNVPTGIADKYLACYERPQIEA